MKIRYNFEIKNPGLPFEQEKAPMIRILLIFTILTAVKTLVYSSDQPALYDLVILNGRVINPETGFDRTGINVGINSNKIDAVTMDSIQGKKTIDAKGLIVAPGFIDILSYDPTVAGMWNKLADGVTANLAMHGGTAYPLKWFQAFGRKKWPIHYGEAFFYGEVRNNFNLSRYQSASGEQIKEALIIAEKALLNGCLGISFSLEYSPGSKSNEIVSMMKLAHRYNVPVFFHTRYSTTNSPGTSIEGLEEVIDYARITGAAVHIDHINSTGGTFCMPEAVRLIENALAEGLDISACVYPYDFWATYLDSARFDPGWQKRFGITYSNLQLGGSGERLTRDSFEKYRRLGKLADAYAIPEEDTINALRAPFVLIGSDGILEDSFNNHPRASGTFCRNIARYVREKKVLTLMDALAKMTIMPARRLEKSCPALRHKGRISEGADADIVIFDFDKIEDHATVEHPEYRSTGINYVIVDGETVMDPQGIDTNVLPGKPIKSEFNR